MLLPLSFDLSGKKIVLIGGGRAALEKFNQLSRTPCLLTVIAPAWNNEMRDALNKQHTAQLTIHERTFQPADVNGAFMVFSAVDDPEVSRGIYELCQAGKILVNSADDKTHCDFYTNAVIDRGSVQLSVSTNGRFAGLSAVLRRHLETLLPPEMDDDWEKVFKLRERALTLQSVIEKKSVITDIVKSIEERYFKGEQE